MRSGDAIWIYRILRFLALVCFFLAAILAAGWGTFANSEALLPLGLLFWCASNGIPT